MAVVLAYASRLHLNSACGGRPMCRPGVRSRLRHRWVSCCHWHGWIIPLSSGRLDRLLGRSGGLLLTGSAVGLVFAYLVRFLAVSLQTVDASLTNIPPSLDDAARSLGASGSRSCSGVRTCTCRSCAVACSPRSSWFLLR